MEIILCSERHIEEVGLFYDKVVGYLDSHVNYPRWRYKDYPSTGSTAEQVALACQYAAYEDGRVVGAFVLNENPQGAYGKVEWSKDLAVGEFMVIHALGTDPDLQGKGYGKAMVHYCIDYAKSRGYKAIRLDVVPDNFPAIRLYERMGFNYVGEVDLERNIPDIPTFALMELNL